MWKCNPQCDRGFWRRRTEAGAGSPQEDAPEKQRPEPPSRGHSERPAGGGREGGSPRSPASLLDFQPPDLRAQRLACRGAQPGVRGCRGSLSALSPQHPVTYSLHAGQRGGGGRGGVGFSVLSLCVGQPASVWGGQCPLPSLAAP